MVGAAGPAVEEGDARCSICLEVSATHIIVLVLFIAVLVFYSLIVPLWPLNNRGKRCRKAHCDMHEHSPLVLN